MLLIIIPTPYYMGHLCPALRAKTEVRVAQGQRAKLKPEAGARKHCAKILTRVEHVIDTRESASHILAILHQIVQEYIQFVGFWKSLIRHERNMLLNY